MKITARTPDQIGNALRRVRKAKGLTQKDVSARTNLRVATISSLENGDPGTQMRTLISVMAALDLEFVVQDRIQESRPSIEDIFS
ncbi:helix-turn-helix domain-containing protein [Thalassospira marina]|uniref:Transcriptional regulator n=1 Tax=Thalassospira marina TaxID=2048283 RepID=A0A2N3KZ77_9PROT|nr:helix-turn-helix domain-containing protein [Thalassospira marina]PKR55780.1 transcriptional regulator [Thalassospira marina]